MVEPSSEHARPNRKGRRLAAASFITLSFAFVVFCIANVASALYGKTAAAAPLETSCALGVRSLSDAVDRALAHSGASLNKSSGTSPIDAFAAALAPEWNDTSPIEARCSSTPTGADAFAVTRRYRSGAEEAVRSAGTDVQPLRAAVAAYLSPTP